MRRVLILIIAAAVVAMALTSCDHREFEYELPSRRVPVVVEFDWIQDADASPEGMTVYFYRDGSRTSRPITYDFKGRDGGSITLMPGTYSAICHNNDSDLHGFIGTDTYEGFGLRLNDRRTDGDINSAAVQRPRDSGERIAHSPDSMWVATVSTIIIAESDIPDLASRTPVTVRFEMLPVVHHYTFHVTNPINFDKSYTVRATLSGMASTVHPGRAMTGEETVTHLFEMSATPDGNLRGEMLTFGHCSSKPAGTRADDDDKPHTLSIFANRADGSQWVSVHDVTDQIHSSPVADCVIRLDSIAFPAAQGGGGISPSVGGWTGDREVIGM